MFLLEEVANKSIPVVKTRRAHNARDLAGGVACGFGAFALVHARVFQTPQQHVFMAALPARVGALGHYSSARYCSMALGLASSEISARGSGQAPETGMGGREWVAGLSGSRSPVLAKIITSMIPGGKLRNHW